MTGRDGLWNSDVKHNAASTAVFHYSLWKHSKLLKWKRLKGCDCDNLLSAMQNQIKKKELL